MSFLEEIIGKKLYEKQKEVLRDLQDNVEGEVKEFVKRKTEDIYKLQKEIVKDVQDKAIEEGKRLANKSIIEVVDRVIEQSGKIKIIGFIIKAVLEKYRSKIITAVIFK